MNFIEKTTDAIRDGKDRAVAKALTLIFNQTQKNLGIMTKLEIDSKNRTVHIELDLKGETSPIIVDVGRYTMENGGAQSYITLANVKTSREWITALADSFIKDTKIPVPSAVRILL